jgi:hypothetical protein
MWKNPSIFAWNHKPDGIMGELFDMKKFNENCAMMQNKSF